RIWRGMDHAQLLSEGLEAELQLPVERQLVRIRNTPPQVHLNRAQRATNVRKAFRVASKAPVRGARVLLVDDVTTTGATANEAARTLLRAGASTVALAVLAIGHGMKVGIVQFVKGVWETGERHVLGRFPDLVTIKAMGEGFTWDTQDRARDIAAAEAGWALESKAYLELLSTTNNMIRGVLFYLAVLLPFSYCLERLLLAGGTIRRRILGMGGIFTVSFVVLALVHPAFRFTLTPLIVLLAFVILSLAAMVSVLIVGKFDRMLQERKAALTGLHQEIRNVGRIALHAVDLGIANIRRRPGRGFLTAMTIVLVTFTLLSFTSLVPELNISRLRHTTGNPDAYRGLMVRKRNWSPLPAPLYESLQRNYVRGADDDSPVAGRGWFFSDFSGRLSQIDLSVADRSGGGGNFTAVALLCILLQANASPFCVLDEVDAMLDEANVRQIVAALREQAP
ncbi:hypothetical protein LCGC14_1791390, partial [marine sediment metagenome]